MAVSDLILRQAFIEYDRRDTDQLLQHYYTDQDGNYKLSSKTHKTIMKYADKIGEHQASEKQGQHSRFGGRRALRTAFLVAVIAALLAITIFAIVKDRISSCCHCSTACNNHICYRKIYIYI